MMAIGTHGDGAAEQHELERSVDVAQRLHHGIHGAEQDERGQLGVDAKQRGENVTGE